VVVADSAHIKLRGAFCLEAGECTPADVVPPRFLTKKHCDVGAHFWGLFSQSKHTEDCDTMAP
jgi:hypothetical protein